MNFLFEYLDRVDRRIIFLFVALSLGTPLWLEFTLPPAKMETADAVHHTINALKPKSGDIVLASLDFGPNTMAENKPQADTSIEHLMRNRIPVAVITIYPLALPFLENIPREIAARLEQENAGEKWVYGKDWVNLGYRAGGILMIQNLGKTDDLAEVLKTDFYGNPLTDLPAMSGVKTIKNIPLLMQFTGLTGTLTAWIQFFQGHGYTPPFVHGCTSISIPDAYNYFSSKQLVGLFEGVAGAAWYDHLLSNGFPKRKAGDTQQVNTGLAFAHLVIILFIILGNIASLYATLRKKD